MYLYFYQIEQLLEAIYKNQKVVGSNGSISEEDKGILLKHGVDFRKLYVKEEATIFKAFNFAMLAVALKEAEALNLSYNELQEYIKKGKYIPISPRQTATIESLKTQSFNDAIGFNSRVFEDVNKILPDNSIGSHLEFIRNEIIEGCKEKKTTKQIANILGHKTGDWGRDFAEIVEYHLVWAFEEGKAEEIKRTSYDKDPLVYKSVSKNGCCKHCVRLYLLNGIESEARVFTLSELRNNGSNEERIESDWRPTIRPTHKRCNCSLTEKRKGYLWNQEKRSFSTPDPNYIEKVKASRPLIRVSINGVIKYL